MQKVDHWEPSEVCTYVDVSCRSDMVCVLHVVPPEEERSLPEKKLGV